MPWPAPDAEKGIDWITVAATPNPIHAVIYTGNHQIVLDPAELSAHIAACAAVLAEIAAYWVEPGSRWQAATALEALIGEP